MTPANAIYTEYLGEYGLHQQLGPGRLLDSADRRRVAFGSDER
jgi:hypothetical protein